MSQSRTTSPSAPGPRRRASPRNGRTLAFFRARESRRALERAAGLPALNGQGREAATRLRDAIEQGDSPNWTSLRGDLDALQRALAR
jgi:hypothetical protein